MSLGSVGTLKPSNVNLEDIEVFYSFSPDRNTEPSNFIKLETTDVLKKKFIDNTSVEAFQGFYTMKLSSDIFSEIGFYSVYIRPKQIKCKIVDCGILAQLPDQKGLVFDINSGDFIDLKNRISPGALTGFRLDYMDDTTGEITPNIFTIVTFSNRCEIISQSSTNTSQKSVVYRFNDSGNLIFLSVSPSSSPSVKANTQPFIGNGGQTVIFSNTYFDPQVIDIEITEYDLKKIGNLIEGERTLNIETGVENIYDENRNILSQSTLYDIKDDFGNDLFKVKQNNKVIDESETWDTITEDVE